MGKTFAEFVADRDDSIVPPQIRKYRKTGFATPSGKVELKSSVLEDLGFDPLPYFREDPAPEPGYPLTLFTGEREDGFFHTGHRHIPELRARTPQPLAFLSPGTARGFDVAEGDWIRIGTTVGDVDLMASVRDSMPDGLVRIPHGWWKPEMTRGLAAGLSGALNYADAQLCRDDPDYLDREQGIPHLKGVPCSLTKIDTPREVDAEAMEHAGRAPSLTPAE